MILTNQIVGPQGLEPANEYQELEMKRAISLVYLLILLGLLTPVAWGQSIIRGPYLQQQTDQSIIVRWRTDVATDSVVRYGTNSTSLNLSSSESGTTTEHTVLITGLSPATEYFYSIGNSAGTIAGDASYHFGTSPVPGDAANTRVWVIGDSGTANSNARAVRNAFKTWSASQPADFMMMLGDNAYNDGTDAEYQNAVFDTYPELLRQLPVWPTLGNHDGHSADSGTQTGPYYEIFDLPKLAEAGGQSSFTEAYYSFDYGNIHVVVLDSYDSDRSTGGNMLQWLESDLALNDKPWLIGIWHHPPYTKGSHNSDTEGGLIDMRQNALPILEAWGVDLVLTGHSHTYERSFLVDGHYGLSGTLDIGTHILDIGDGAETSDGAYQKPDVVAAQNEGAVYAVAGSSGKLSTGYPLNHPVMFIALESLGSMVLDVAGNRMDVTFLDQNALIRDEFTILKTPDIEAPLINGASAEDASHVLVDYSERIDITSAENITNYQISGLSVVAAEVLTGNASVRLTTSVMTSGTAYVLTINNVKDESNNTIATNSQVGFEFNNLMTRAFQDGMVPDTGYDGSFDTYIREATASTNYGVATTLQVDGDEPSGSGTDMSILLGWDISSIPADATVQSAIIYLNILNISSGPYYCYGLLRSWEQVQASWIDALSGDTWVVAGAQGAGDRDSLPVCTVSAPGTGTLAIELNNDGLALVQSWVDGSLANHGIVIADPATSDGADFDSSESTNVMNRPKLELVYTVPGVIPNAPPVASFTDSCTSLDCSFTDTSTDSDGTITDWAWDFGDGNTSILQSPSYTYAVAGNYTVSLTVTDSDGATGVTSANISVTEPPDFVDYTANGQIAVSGTVTGSFTDTQTDNSVSQSVRERLSGGKKQNRYSFLEHKWTFQVSPSAGFVFNLNAWSSGSSDGDSFVFAWSSNDSNYTDFLTINSTNQGTTQAVVLPITLNGTVYIRVRDSDRTALNTNLDTVYDDHMYIHSETAPGSPPVAPSGLGATTLSASSIELSWTDNSADELGFELQRLTDDSDWTDLPGLGADTLNISDTGLLSSTTYYYRVRAFNLSGSSAWSATAFATTEAGPPPADITLSLDGRKNKGKHIIDLTWTGTTTANVEIEIYRDGDSPFTVPDTGSYTDNTNNKGGRVYTYKVCEVDTGNCSAEENIVF